MSSINLYTEIVDNTIVAEVNYPENKIEVVVSSVGGGGGGSIPLNYATNDITTESGTIPGSSYRKSQADEKFLHKLDPQDPNANKIYRAGGTLVDLPTPAPKQIQQIPTYNDLPVPGEEGIVYYIIDEDEDYAWSNVLNDYYDYVEAKGFLDDRASNLVDDLTEEEKLIIKSKLGVIDSNHIHSSEDTAGTTITFDKMRDYGLSAPIDNFTFDLSDANRGIVQHIYFNGTALPVISQVKWLNNSNLYFESGINYRIEMEYKNASNIYANLVKI